jgi:hypothetical protein
MGRKNRALQDHSITREVGTNEDWPAVLDEYGVQFLALDLHSDSELVKLFRAQPGWTVDFEDRDAIIFARADTAQVTDFPIYPSTN